MSLRLRVAHQYLLVPRLPLHSGLAVHWPALDAASDDVHLLVDAANVVGSRPDGW